MPTINVLKGAVLAVSALVATAPAGAVITTFASYTAISTADNLRFQKVGTAGGSLYTVNGNSNSPSSVAVKFNFLDSTLAAFGPLDASYTLGAAIPVGTAAVTAGNFIVQPNVSGSFSFRYTGTSPLVVGNTSYSTGANLLTGVFTDAGIAGAIGASASNLSASSTSGSTIVFTSDILDFTNVINTGLAINMTSIRPGLGQAGANASLNSFRTSSGGSFSAEPAPVIGSVPEPATWAMMVMGFGLVGYGVRRRERAVPAHA